MAHVIVNSNREVAIELSRTAKHVRCVVKLENSTRDVRNLPLSYGELIGSGVNKILTTRHFDKEWQPLTTGAEPYPVKNCILKMLLAQNYIPLTERARKELIMVLVISKEFQVIAKFEDEAFKQAVNAAPEGGYVVKNAEELVDKEAGFTKSDLIAMHNSIAPAEQHLGEKPKATKEEIAHKIFELAQNMVEEKPKQKPASSGEGVKKVGIKKQIRELLTKGERFTLEELVEKFGDDKKTSITTALSDLRSEKYAGEGGPINITKDENKRYHIEVTA